MNLDGSTPNQPKLYCKLTNLFKILHEGFKDLVETAHWAGSDAEMARMNLGLFFRAWLDMPMLDESDSDDGDDGDEEQDMIEWEE